MAFTINFQGNTVALPSPEFDDAYERSYRKIVRESRGKELITFPKKGYTYLKSFDTYNYKFKFISEPVKQQLINFLDRAVGQVLGFTDYNGDEYWGIILTPSLEIVNASRNNNEFNLEIEVISYTFPF